jgi:PAS domain S-box-containing protein
MRRLGCYGLALLLVATGALARVVLTHLVGPDLPEYLTFYPAVMLAALVGGWGPGLLATLVTVILMGYWLLPPAGFMIGNHRDVLGLVFFGVVSTLLSIVAELYRRTRDHLEELIVLRTAALNQLSRAHAQLREQSAELQAQKQELTTVNAVLRESEERHRAFFEQAGAAIVVFDPHTLAVVEFNDEACRHLGYTRAEFAGLRIPDIDVIESAADTQQHARQVAQDGSDIFETRHRTKQGAMLDIEVRAKPIHLADRLLIQAFWRDVTERKRAEEALRGLNATLESKVAERTRELEQRALQLQKLTLEISQAEEQERKRIADILHDDLQQLVAAAKFQLSLMRHRVRHEAPLQATALEIEQMLKEAIEKSRSLSHELSPALLYQGDFQEALHGLALQTQAKHGLVVHVDAAGQRRVRSDAIKAFLYRTAQELLFNVVKHARVHEATIRLRRRGPYICLSVSDRGRGFDPQRLRQTAGFGLLSIRERIELLGGRMKIRSAPGKGSTFLLVVPDSPAAGGVSEVAPRVHGQTTEAGRYPAEDDGRLRVLLADDHKIVRGCLRSLLSDQNDVEIVGEAADGREAVDLALRLKPHVVIMDVSMPLIDGDEATRHIKTRLPRTRIIALSTYNEPEMIQRMYRAGAEDYVLKTASSEELLAAIRGQAHPGGAPTDENDDRAASAGEAIPSLPQ